MSESIEREKKYLVSEEKAQKLKAISKWKLGVVQWYLQDCSFFDFAKDKNIKNCRVRYMVDETGNEKWIVAFKSELMEGFKRIEEEYEIRPNEALWNNLIRTPVAAKVRYFISEKPAEIVLDEFVELEKPYNVSVKYLVEIETHEDFEIYEKEYELGNGLNYEEFDRYTNKNIAIVSSIPPRLIVEKIRQIMGVSSFKMMRRKDRELPIGKALEIIEKGEYGVLSTFDGEYPYGVPVNYAYKDGIIYIHCALDGKKLENISKHPKVSFSVIAKSKVLPEKLTTAYESAIAFGSAELLEGPEKKVAIFELVKKYSPQFAKKYSHIDETEENEECKNTAIIKITIEYISGKSRAEWV
ncbi:MAG: pyridoxamine 5'-phosphate oxidase family protein [Fervidobacterium pennivorans]|uniref:Flavin-nucleotide-binding protein n=1 Tax=Fervidobacterium pennivorans (strain DSM 9078 / Ven5) TaxID=771875 RepID=H9UE79_FERPD|nr:MULTISPECIES: pyridoxamine 5'-phosphate oxidase family protein [Fervidobacterium]AFG35822.1 putative flavin-nucleotide-binding protein [Fervidobacterium pennivorans DSM 9078]MDM7320742.1 pyridoxamine 5'-phosphate oxidase family protein [Fervidobacterium sp.]